MIKKFFIWLYCTFIDEHIWSNLDNFQPSGICIFCGCKYNGKNKYL